MEETPPDLQSWLERTSPAWTWHWPHQIVIYEKLKLMTAGALKRLMIFMPPRHAKSETVTVRYSAYRLSLEPKMHIILGCYNQSLANRFSRKVRSIAVETAALSKDKTAADEWETAAGGGLRAVGVPADL